MTAHREPAPNSTPRPSRPSDELTWTAGVEPVPAELTAIRWADGTIECRSRLMHPAGSLVADDGEVGVVLTDEGIDCTDCSSACSS